MLSTPHAMPIAPAALPRTGQVDSRSLDNWLLLAAVIGLIASGWLLRRRLR